MWIQRAIEPLLLDQARTRPVVVLTGGRQTGKTSLVRRLFPGLRFVSLDLPSEAEQAEHDPRSFLKRHPLPVVIDEVQYAPALFRHIKSVVDADRTRAGQFILTGSQKFSLMRSVSESLAGRAAVLELETLSMAEIEGARPTSSLEERIVRGGFPELHAMPDLDHQGFYRSIVSTYLERDLRQLLQVTSLRDFERFLRACAMRTGCLLNRADLSRDVGISGSTAAAWLSVLEASGQVALLEPWFANRTKSLIKTPKLYMCDTGLACFLVGIRSAEDLVVSPVAGALWETLVFGELRRSQINRTGGWTLNFWRDRSREADFLFHRGGRFDLADAKWSEAPSLRDAVALGRVASELPAGTVDRQAIVCRATHPYPLTPDVEARPIHDLPDDWK